MKFGAEFPRDASLSSIIEMARICDESGFYSIWVTDLLARGELWTTLTAIALNTKRVRFGPDVTTPFTRHPIITAHALATLQDISGGRAVMGVGSGIRNILGQVGIHQPHPIIAVRECIDIIRSLLSGTESSYSGSVFTLDKFRLPLASSQPVPPFYLACMSEQEAMLAAEICDGIITISLDNSYLKKISTILDGTAAKRKKILVSWAIGCLVDDIQLAKRDVGPLICPMLSNLPDKAMKFLNIQQSEREIARNAAKNNAWDSLSDRAMNLFALFGPREDVLKKVGDLDRMGVDEIILHFKSKEDLISFRNRIMPVN